MSARIADAFAAAADEGRAALVGYLTAYDPDREGSLRRIEAACEAGLDVLELGVPFSDPTADGTAVQGAMVRALQAGATLAGALEIAAEVRRRFAGPIVLFSYANPLYAMGVQTLATRAADAGIDGLLVVDVPPEHAAELRDPAAKAGLSWIPLVAPTTGADRIGSVVEGASGFIYAVTLRGVTGSALDTERPELAAQLARIRAHCSVPIAAGFGVRTAQQARALGRHADGVVVGSALIEAGRDGPEALARAVATLRAGLQRAEPEGDLALEGGDLA